MPPDNYPIDDLLRFYGMRPAFREHTIDIPCEVVEPRRLEPVRERVSDVKGAEGGPSEGGPSVASPERSGPEALRGETPNTNKEQ